MRKKYIFFVRLNHYMLLTISVWKLNSFLANFPMVWKWCLKILFLKLNLTVLRRPISNVCWLGRRGCLQAPIFGWDHMWTAPNVGSGSQCNYLCVACRCRGWVIPHLANCCSENGRVWRLYIQVKQACFAGCSQTLPDEAPPIGKIHSFSKIAVTFKAMQRFHAQYQYSLFYDWMHHC